MQYTFPKIYPKTSDSDKINFLNHLLEANQSLQLKFVNFVTSEPMEVPLLSMKEFQLVIDKYMQEYKKALLKVDLEEPDWDNYTPSRSGYMEQWEQFGDASEQELRVTIVSCNSQTIDLLLKQKIDQLVANLLGFYNACMAVDLEDPFDSFEDVNDFLLSELAVVITAIIEKIGFTIFSDNSINHSVKMVLEYGKTKVKTQSKFVKTFQPLLLALLHKSNNPKQMLNYLEGSKILFNYFPLLVSFLYIDDNNKWLDYTIKRYRYDIEIAKQLLIYYHEHDKGEFTILAAEMFNNKPNDWAIFLKDHLTITDDKKLYVKVYFELITTFQHIEDYIKVKDHLSQKQFDKLLAKLKRNKVFVVKILEVEEKYEEIKEIFIQNKNSYSYNDIILPILNIYPEFCYKMIKNKVLKEVKTERGRPAYELIVSRLQLAKQIIPFTNEANQLIEHIYLNNTRLRALRDEMKIGGLIKQSK